MISSAAESNTAKNAVQAVYVLDHDFAFSFKEIYPEGNSRLTDDMLKGIAVIVLFYMGYTVSITTPVTQ